MPDSACRQRAADDELFRSGGDCGAGSDRCVGVGLLVCVAMGSANFAERYAAMSETELMKLARGYDDLVEEAQTALRDEFARRGLEPPLIEEEEPLPADDEAEPVTVGQYTDLPEALISRAVLEEAGIRSFLSDENTVSNSWGFSNAMGGIRLQVAAEDEKAAREVLSQFATDQSATDSNENFVQPVCPQCGSIDVIANGHGRTAREATWRCMECDSTWVDDEELAGQDETLG